MVLQFIRLEILKSLRSTAFSRSVLIAIFLTVFAILLLSYVLVLGLFLNMLIRETMEIADAIAFVNSHLFYFFLFEFLYRYFLQKLPVMGLQYFLHLPIRKSVIVHFLLVKSFISPLSIIPLLLFIPFSVQEVAPAHGNQAACFWMLSIALTSWAIHWAMLWFKQKFEDSFIGVLIVFLLLLASAGANYFEWYNPGELLGPLFALGMSSPVPLIGLGVLFLATYSFAFIFYRKNAYLENMDEQENFQYAQNSIGFFSRFGLAGEMADLEWKLILRHKKSRSYLMLTVFFLAYGLFFYTNQSYQVETGISYFFILIGTFVTGIFMMNYGQLFISWNSASLDFFLTKPGGLEALVKGKYLLFVSISCLCFLLTVPYVFLGWDILFIHIATFLFNMGVSLHLVLLMSLWKPKPMDLGKGAMFNYEGVGLAQFLMFIPVLAFPYVIFVPFALWLGDYVGLVALGTVGAIGVMAFPILSQSVYKKLLRTRYQVSATFRKE